MDKATLYLNIEHIKILREHLEKEDRSVSWWVRQQMAKEINRILGEE
jgi:hypothetical protein